MRVRLVGHVGPPEALNLLQDSCRENGMPITSPRIRGLASVLIVAMFATGCGSEADPELAATTSTNTQPTTSEEIATSTSTTATSTTEVVQPPAPALDDGVAPPPPSLPPIPAFPDSLGAPPAPPVGLTEFVAGHNRLDADRINLIFSQWGWDDFDLYRATVELFLNWDGHAKLVDEHGYLSPDGKEAVLGLFGIEPFRSNRHLFNIWITEQAPPGPALWLNTDDDPFDLPDQVIATLALEPWLEVPGISPGVAGLDASFSGFATAAIPTRNGDDPFSNLMVSIDSRYPASHILLLPHELGHAMFGLADEYVGRSGGDDGAARGDIWPSCAGSLETAQAWWGDMIGEYDPMIDIWAQELAAAGDPTPWEDIEVHRDLVRTANIADGCWGNPGTFLSAEDTMMGFNEPAYGLTNRRRAEQILELWTGKVPS